MVGLYQPKSDLGSGGSADQAGSPVWEGYKEEEGKGQLCYRYTGLDQLKPITE